MVSTQYTVRLHVAERGLHEEGPLVRSPLVLVRGSAIVGHVGPLGDGPHEKRREVGGHEEEVRLGSG